jgi:mannosyl-3-phosphoglycerate phosphatase
LTPDRVLFSGAGGGLLDPDTGSYEPARPAIAALARLGVPLVLCSSRPRREIMLLWRLLGLGAPVIVENGAALIVPDGHLRRGVPGGEWDGEFHVLRLGPRRETLREALLEVAAAARVEVRIPAAPGREHSEPFLVETEEDAEALVRGAAARGLRVARAESLYHLCGGADKGLAVRTLLSLYQREGRLPTAIALGAWQVDLPMLRAVHRPVVLPGPGGEVEPLLAAELKHAERARRGGPEGWNEAVLAVLAERRLPTVSPGARPGDDCRLVFEGSRRTA